MNGFDAAREVGSLAARLNAAKIDFVCRYYSRNPAKNLSAGEATALGAAGIRLVSVWEAAGDLLASFGPAQGARDAADALKLAAAIGQPPGSAIYFAVDFDATAAEIAHEIGGYFAAIRTALAGRYKVGVYGSGLVCATLRDAGQAEYLWLACAGGWAGTSGFTGWHIHQSLPSDPWNLGFEVDPDTAVDGDFGAWSPAAA
jgi:hypothetical protein